MSQLAACVELGSRSRFNPFAKFEKTGSVHSIGSGIGSGTIENCVFDDCPPRGRRPGRKLTLWPQQLSRIEYEPSSIPARSASTPLDELYGVLADAGCLVVEGLASKRQWAP